MPALERFAGMRLITARHGIDIDHAQRHLQAPRPRTLERTTLQPVHRPGLLGAPTAGIAARMPHPNHLEQLAFTSKGLPDDSWLTAHFLPAHPIHGFIGHDNHMKAVVADLGTGQRPCRALGVGSAYILANPGWLPTVRLQISGKVQHRLVIASLTGRQQPLGIQIVHQGDVVFSLAQAVFVNHNNAHGTHIVQGSNLFDVVRYALPQCLVRAAQQRSRLAHRQLAAQRQRQSFKQCGEARALACPQHAHLRCPAATRAGDARHIGVQPSLELKEIQVPPGAAQPVVHALLGGVAVRAAAQALGIAAHLKADVPLARVQVHRSHFPWRHQVQRTSKQRFNFNAHGALPLQCAQTLRGYVDKPLTRLAHISIQPATTGGIVGVGFHTK